MFFLIFGYCTKTASLDKVNFIIYDVETWEAIAIHILPNISRSKGN